MVANTLGGVLLDTGTKNNRIGGATTAERNVISGNGGPGVTISGTATLSNTITGNVIGLRSASAGGAFAIPGGNNGDGVLITGGAKYSRVGGTEAEGNTIGANTGNGIRVSGSGTDNTILQSNLIGTSFTNNSYLALGNSQNGVQVDGQAVNTQITGSKIYSNTLKGVLVSGTGTQRVKIFDNSMQGNLTGGIDLTPETTTPPAGPPTGSASNPNHDIDPPYGLHIDQTGKLTGKVRLTPNNPAVSACAQPCTIQIFAANPQTADGQGRDKLNVTVSLTPDSQDPSIGNFSASVSSVPAQLALTATDKDGNTSEFATLTRQFGLDIQPPRASSANPGQTVIYTHRITNTGTVDFTNVQFSASSKLGWTTKLEPSSPITLLQGESKPVTLTLTLPSGSATNVRAGLVEQTRLTVSATTINPSVVTSASITDTTTVLGKFILDASFKNGRAGTGAPGTVIDYTRTLTNTGNLTGTVTLTASTDLAWTTSITPTTVQLPPGKSIGVRTSVTIPQGATANTVAKTTLRLNGTPDAQNLVITDTTTVLLTPKATMVFNDIKDGAAGETVQFCHTVTNLSNGPATFTLTGVSSLGSKITFVSDTPGRQLVNGKTFTVGITNADKIFNFCANVVVDPLAEKGQTDFISIGLTDEQGAVVGGASVRDQINVVRGDLRIYLPVARR
ncbi:MAG TPA: NEW3 domain-containing protein, partial [Roseiflexaceae bacterium]|nr:NEW3 domain-containing protein [Roseiflexaceae bacterium]